MPPREVSFFRAQQHAREMIHKLASTYVRTGGVWTTFPAHLSFRSRLFLVGLGGWFSAFAAPFTTVKLNRKKVSLIAAEDES